MKVEKWIGGSASRLEIEVQMDAEETPTQMLEFVDHQAREKNIWLLGRAVLRQEEDRIRIQTCVLPAMELPQIDDHTVEYRLKQPTETQVEQQLQMLAQTRMISTVDDQPARLGDVATLDFDAVLENGTRFSGSMGRNGMYRLASGKDLPDGVWQAVVGKKAGELFNCKVQIPHTYDDKRAAGKTAVYTGTVKKIVHQSTPVLDDAFARSFGQENLLALREQIKSKLVEQETEVAKSIVARRALHALCNETIVELPTLAVELETAYQWRQLEERLKKSGISMESHLRRLRKTMKELDASIRTHAAEELKLRAVFLAVARQEDLTVTDVEIEAAAKAAAQGRMGVQIDRMQLRQRLDVEKGMQYVLERLILTPAEQQAAE